MIESMTSNELEIKDGVATLCCGGKKCPTLRIVGSAVHIVDDYGSAVEMTVDQAHLISRALQALQGDKAP